MNMRIQGVWPRYYHPPRFVDGTPYATVNPYGCAIYWPIPSAAWQRLSQGERAGCRVFEAVRGEIRR